MTVVNHSNGGTVWDLAIGVRIGYMNLMYELLGYT